MIPGPARCWESIARRASGAVRPDGREMLFRHFSGACRPDGLQETGCRLEAVDCRLCGTFLINRNPCSLKPPVSSLKSLSARVGYGGERRKTSWTFLRIRSMSLSCLRAAFAVSSFYSTSTSTQPSALGSAGKSLANPACGPRSLAHVSIPSPLKIVTNVR